MMWDRLLFAIDQFESGQTALRFAAGVAEASTADVRVLHLRELPKWARVPRSRLPPKQSSSWPKPFSPCASSAWVRKAEPVLGAKTRSRCG